MPDQQIALISYNHQNAPVEFRDQLALDKDAILRFIEAGSKGAEFIHELAAISTCNRTEFYFLTSDPQQLWSWLSDQFYTIKQIRIDQDGAPQPLLLRNGEAVAHLLEVAGGLQSMLLGENQILSQVRDSYEHLLSSGNQFPVMNRLFQAAIHAGKLIRTNTKLCQGSVSISLAAVELARKIYSNFGSRRIVLIGAGETAELVALHFQELGVTQFTVVNRGLQRRKALAQKYTAKALPLKAIPEALAEADVVVAATQSPQHLITYEVCARIMADRKASSLLIVDISTPRNVDPEIARIPQVFLYDIDDIKYVIADNLEKRKKEIPPAKRIVREIRNDFTTWFKTLEVVPTISRLNAYFNSIRTQELGKYVHKTSPKEYERMEEMSKSIVRKLLHYPIVELREQGNSGRNDLAKINALWELFRLGELEDQES